VDGHYQLQQLYVERGAIAMKTSAEGIRNYDFIKESKGTSTPENSHFNFHLNRIRLKDVEFGFEDLASKQHYQLYLPDITSTLSYRNDQIQSALEGNCLIQLLAYDEQELVKDKNLAINTLIDFEVEKKDIVIHPSALRIGKGEFKLEGFYKETEQQHLYLKVDGRNTNFKTLLSFTPKSVRNQLNAYRTSGKAYFNALIDGSLAGKQQPSIQVDFGCQEVSLTPPNIPIKVSQLQFKGHFSNGKKRKLSTSVLKLDHIQGLLKDRAFRASFQLTNLIRPKVVASVKSALDLADFHQFYPSDAIESLSGNLDIDLKLNGNIQNKWGMKATGELTAKDIILKPKEYPLAIQLDSSHISLSDKKMGIQYAVGKIGDSDFQLSGAIQFWHQLLAGAWQNMEPKLKLQSKQLLLGQLIPKTSAKSNKKTATKSTLSLPKLDLSIRADQLSYKDWHMKQASGRIQIDQGNQVRLKNMKFGLFDGQILIDGLLAIDQPHSMYAGSAEMQRVDIKKFFQAFNDFDLEAISYKNLEGRLNAKLSAQMILDESWNAKWDLMDAVIVGKILNGKLVDYEPMQRLAIFMQNNDLKNITFSELSDTIFINNNTLTLPRMEIKSSVGNMFISGFQQIDGEMEYHLQIPLKNFKKPDKDEAFGAIADDGLGNGNLFLVIKGTADNYKIAYDKKEVVKKIKEDLKKEKKEFSSLFKKKQKEKQVGLKDDYFR